MHRQSVKDRMSVTNTQFAFPTSEELPYLQQMASLVERGAAGFPDYSRAILRQATNSQDIKKLVDEYSPVVLWMYKNNLTTIPDEIDGIKREQTNQSHPILVRCLELFMSKYSFWSQRELESLVPLYQMQQHPLHDQILGRMLQILRTCYGEKVPAILRPDYDSLESFVIAFALVYEALSGLNKSTRMIFNIQIPLSNEESPIILHRATLCTNSARSHGLHLSWDRI